MTITIMTIIIIIIVVVVIVVFVQHLQLVMESRSNLSEYTRGSEYRCFLQVLHS